MINGQRHRHWSDRYQSKMSRGHCATVSAKKCLEFEEDVSLQLTTRLL
jgi:hypothetical protein